MHCVNHYVYLMNILKHFFFALMEAAGNLGEFDYGLTLLLYRDFRLFLRPLIIVFSGSFKVSSLNFKAYYIIAKVSTAFSSK